MVRAHSIPWTDQKCICIFSHRGFFRNHLTISCIYLSKHFGKFYLFNLKDHLCLFEKAYLW